MLNFLRLKETQAQAETPCYMCNKHITASSKLMLGDTVSKLSGFSLAEALVCMLPQSFLQLTWAIYQQQLAFLWSQNSPLGTREGPLRNTCSLEKGRGCEVMDLPCGWFHL